MKLHLPGSPGEQSVNATADVMQAALTEAQQKFRDEPGQAKIYILLAFEWIYYLKNNEVVSVDNLVRDYEALRNAPQEDIALLRAQLENVKSGGNPYEHGST